MSATKNRSKFSLRKSKRCFFFALTTAVCWILMISNASVSGAATAPRTSSASSAKKSEYADQGVIDLTSKSFGSSVGFGDGEVWLIEFYTPSCSHCVNFAATYQNIAMTLHSSVPDEKIRVARVNCSVEKALMTRFGVNSFPSFFLVSGWDVYEFSGKRSQTSLQDFARGGYKKKSKIPFMNSPMGPMGLMQGTLIYVGTRAMGVLEYMHDKLGISPIVSGVIICMGGVFCGMISIILLTVLSTPTSPEKVD